MSEARARGLEAADRGCPGAPDVLTSGRFPGNSDPRRAYFLPQSESKFFFWSCLPPTPHLAPLLISPPPPPSPKPPTSRGPHLQLPSPPGFLRKGEGGVREGHQRKPGGGDGGGGQGLGELFTRKSRGYVFEPPRPRPGCIVLARAPGSRGGPNEVRWPGRRRAALCLGCAPLSPPGPPARAQLPRGAFSHRVPAPQPRCPLPPPVSLRSQPAERAGDPGRAAGVRAGRKSNHCRPISSPEKEFLCYLHGTGLSF